jgi:hypothetical protein
VKVAASTILKDAGVEPAPERTSSTGATFLRSQTHAVIAADFFETTTLTGAKLCILAVIEHATRRIRILGATTHPTAAWVTRAARNLMMDLEDAGLREYRQTTLEGRRRQRPYPGLLKDSQTVELAGRPDDPGKHELLEHRVALGGLLESEYPLRVSEGVPQVPHPRRGDRQRPTRRRGAVQAEVEFALPGRHPLLGGRFQHRQFGVVVRRSNVLDIARPRRVLVRENANLVAAQQIQQVL